MVPVSSRNFSEATSVTEVAVPYFILPLPALRLAINSFRLLALLSGPTVRVNALSARVATGAKSIAS